MKGVILSSILLFGCVLNENGETDAPPPCDQPVIDTTGLKNICKSAELTQGNSQ
jgi:hypothetical protein